MVKSSQQKSMILYIENHMESTKLQIINEVTNFKEYKIKTQKSIVFLHTVNEKFKMKLIIPLTIAS